MASGTKKATRQQIEAQLKEADEQNRKDCLTKIDAVLEEHGLTLQAIIQAQYDPSSQVTRHYCAGITLVPAPPKPAEG